MVTGGGSLKDRPLLGREREMAEHTPRQVELQRRATDRKYDCSRCRVSMPALLLTHINSGENLCRNCVSDLYQMEITRTSQNDALKQQNTELVEALEKIMRMHATSPLEACAYQGPPPKKWLREVAPALEARYNAVREAQNIARAAIEKTGGTDAS